MTSSLILAAAAILVSALLCAAGLRAWRAWLDLRRFEIARRSEPDDPEQDVGVRIELAAVRERLKKLEAIASGVEL